MNRRQTFLREASQHKEELAQMLKDKLKEAVSSVLPIIMIVMVLCFTIAPVSSGIMLEFIIGAVCWLWVWFYLRWEQRCP